MRLQSFTTSRRGKGRRRASEYKVRLSHARFAAIGEPNVAVCLLPGTEVAFEKEVERDHAFDRLLPRMRFGKLGDKVARFRQLNMDRPNVHHDALEFPDGQIVLVTRLCEGQHATVLQLPAFARVASAAQEQVRASPVV